MLKKQLKLREVIGYMMLNYLMQLLMQIKSAEHASAQVMNLLNSMVEAKYAHQ